ncbi:MAG: hypothetical protein CFH31_01138 [Alphaproteobacteria bacterium MarineAlpha9_Bin1]|nr:MAG: hypothetical protein CFH31_01138 [Alphaproteobacteria bacterium MarineAlpha9_Bin1]
MEDQHFIVLRVKNDSCKIFIKIFVFVIICLFYYNTAYTQGFLDCIEDIPLMNELVEKKDSCFYFDSNEGRVANVEVEGNLDKNDILDFYRNILPQLGWKINDDRSYENILKFRRENELVNIMIHENNQKSLVTFFSFLLLEY